MGSMLRNVVCIPAGKISGVHNGDAKSHEPQVADHRHACK